MRVLSPLKLADTGVGRSSVSSLLHEVGTLCPLGWAALVHSESVYRNTSGNRGDASFPRYSREVQYWGSCNA